MGKRLKTWTALGVAVAASGAIMNVGAKAGSLQMPGLQVQQSYILIDAASGDGGEQGGEGGGGAQTTYALESTDANAYNFDAAPQIDAYIALVHSSYEKAVADAKILEGAVDAFLATPSEATLIDARKAWLAARPAYLHTEAFRFYDGPIDAVEGEINSWPMNEAYIDYVEGKPDSGLVNDPKTRLDVDGLEAINQKQDEADVTIGWHAVEFLLWGQDLSATGAGNRPFTDYIAAKSNNDRRRQYLQLVTSQLIKEMQSLETKWRTDQPDTYAGYFKALPQREALGRIVNGMAILAGYEFMSERLAVALDSGDQEDEHSCFSDNTKQDFVHDLVGIKRVWTEAKLNELVKSRDPVLAGKVDTLFADAETKIAALGDPWDKVLAAPKNSPERKDAEAVVAAMQTLADGLKAAGNKLGVLVLVPTG
jgi:putative iron-regulated protein